MNKKFREILAILSPAERKKFYLLLFLDALASILDIAFLVLLIYVIGFYTGNYETGSLAFSKVELFDKYPLLLISVFFLLFALKNLFGFLVTRHQLKFVYKVASRISGEKLGAYLDAEYGDYIGINSAVHVRRISQQPVEFAHYVLRGLQQIISSFILILVAVIPILIFNVQLFFMLLLVLIPPAFIALMLMKKRMAAIRQSNKLTREKTMQHLNEALDGFIEINLYNRQDYFRKRYKVFQEKFNDSLAALQVAQSLPPRLMEVFAVFGLFILITASAMVEREGSINVLLIGGFMAAAYKIIPGIVRMLNSREQIKTYAFTIDDLLPPSSARNNTGSAVSGNINSIECRDLEFSFENKKIISHFSMKLERGDFTGLSGISGQGKTTIINIILGFLEPASGTILINNKPVDARQRKQYWNRMAYARQQQFFLNGSIRENILLGREEDQHQYWELASLTGIDKFEDIILAENGKNISGGQRQRLILARTLYQDSDLIILDEPFNELDRVATDQLLRHISKLAEKGKLVLLVTHDRHSLDYCNKIITLDAN